MSFSEHRLALPALLAFSVCESVFFPVPSLVLQIPMTLKKREHAWRHAAVNTLGSVIGGALGHQLAHWARPTMLALMHKTDADFEKLRPYLDNELLLTAGALAIHPFKFFALACGALDAPLAGVMAACLVGRGILFFGIAALLWKFGAPVRAFIDRWFNWLCLGLGLLIACMVLLTRL